MCWFDYPSYFQVCFHVAANTLNTVAFEHCNTDSTSMTAFPQETKHCHTKLECCDEHCWTTPPDIASATRRHRKLDGRCPKVSEGGRAVLLTFRFWSTLQIEKGIGKEPLGCGEMATYKKFQAQNTG